MIKRLNPLEAAKILARLEDIRNKAVAASQGLLAAFKNKITPDLTGFEALIKALDFETKSEGSQLGVALCLNFIFKQQAMLNDLRDELKEMRKRLEELENARTVRSEQLPTSEPTV